MYLLTLNKLKAFRKTVYFEDISFGLINEFDRYLFKKGLGTNSVGKHHDRLKTYINMAIKNDFLKIDQNPYNKFKVGGEEPDRVYLTIEELNQMEELAIPPGKKHLERIRDVFLMATYTGLRYGDVTSLTAAHVVRSQRGISLSLKAEKTGKNLTLPLYFLFREEEAEQSKPEKLISKYLKIIDALGEDEDARNIPFFSVTNQYMNRALKEIARMAGINKNLTSHVARRTFATIMATKVKAPVLQRLLQHARPDMTNIYIQLSNHHIENELEKIDWN
jgi:integrase